MRQPGGVELPTTRRRTVSLSDTRDTMIEIYGHAATAVHTVVEIYLNGDNRPGLGFAILRLIRKSPIDSHQRLNQCRIDIQRA